MSADKPEKYDKSNSMDASSTSHTSGHIGLHDDDDYVFRVRRLSISEDNTFNENPVPKTIEELGGDVEMQQPEGEDLVIEQEQRCLSPKCVTFAVIGGAAVFGAIFTIIRMRANHYESLEDF